MSIENNKSKTDWTKPARWFRMYAEFATDPKVQMLPEADQRRFVMLLCFRCSNGDVTLHDSEVAFQLRISEQEWGETKQRLLSRNLIKDDNNPAAWEKRQCASDSSAERVRKHRELQKRNCNVTETLPKRESNALEKEIEKEKEKKNTQKKSAAASGDALFLEDFEIVWGLYPKRPGASKADALKAYTARRKEGITAEEIAEGVKRYAKYCAAEISEPKFIKQPETFFGPGRHFESDWNKGEIKDEPEKPKLTAETVMEFRWDGEKRKATIQEYDDERVRRGMDRKWPHLTDPMLRGVA